MHVVVFTRSTPDTAAKVEVNGAGSIQWDETNAIINPWDEYALEEAITYTKDTGGDSTVIAIGPEIHEEALRKSLAMGMKAGIRVTDDALDSNDSLAYATAAAATVNKLGDVDLVICGKESIDVNTDQHIYQMARKLGWPMLSFVSKVLEIDFEAKTIKVEKMLEQGKQIITSSLPAVVTVLKGINEPRYPTLINIRKSRKIEIPVWSLADLGITLPAARTQVLGYKNPPTQDSQVEMIEGTPEEQATQLVERLLEEKVL